MTSAFDTAPSPATAAPDPTKHVKYTLGMILGADDFDQEFAWLSGRDRWLARDLLGYGTVNGLRVSIRQGIGIEPQVEVSCGSAILPPGDLVRVTPAQCAPLNAWLGHRADDVAAHAIGSPADLVSIYVVLCADSCETDARPIPGEPCRSEADTMAPSRIADRFRLELRLQAPIHEEERAVRRFVHWLGDAVEIGAGPSSGTLDEFLDRLRESSAVTSPPGADFDPASPPDRFVLDRYDACEYLRAALRVWVTELRPRWHEEFGACHGCPGSQSPTPDAPEPCLLLAQLAVPLNAQGLVDDHIPIEIIEDDRPVLAHLRLLQEWSMCGPSERGGGGGGGGGIGPRGPRGDKGPDGDKGPRGDKGERGDPGPAGEKGAAGDQGQPGPTGNKGDKGAPGDQGAKGDIGDKGDKGDKGERGDKGEKGDKGDPGDRGDKGERGDKGDKGDKGDPGDKGDKGDRGDKGEKGDKGDQGERGDKGEKGDKGDPGDKGEKGERGDKGDPGDRGDKGERGDKGDPGDKGEKGEKGDRGDKGDKGDKGDQGDRGARGDPGDKGAAGDKGPAGDPGDPAALLGRFVELAPNTQNRFFIVAAGTVSLNQRPERAPTYNALAVTGVGGDGRVTLTYDGYAPPRPDEFQAVVKALPVSPNTDLTFQVNFVEFLAPGEGFVLRVTDSNGRPLDERVLASVELMVEVSLYHARR